MPAWLAMLGYGPVRSSFMSLVPEQAILSVQTSGKDVAEAIDELHVQLEAYSNARITSLDFDVDPWGWRGSG